VTISDVSVVDSKLEKCVERSDVDGMNCCKQRTVNSTFEAVKTWVRNNLSEKRNKTARNSLKKCGSACVAPVMGIPILYRLVDIEGSN
jgi:hypothetical protein